jgi:acyl-CoA synthetase (AMP-forming)/AMP-acid ligase II
VRHVRSLGGDAAYPCAEVAAGETAAVLFTSGSTGVAKGAVYTHGTFAAQVAAIRRLFDIRPGEVDLATFPLFTLFAPALGMTAVVPDMDPTRPAQADPRKLVRAVEDWGVTNVFGSPALINVLGRYGQAHGVRLPSLKRVITAGAPVPSATVERMAAMLAPGVEVYTPYGATECLPVACIGGREILGETRHATAAGNGICVGRPVPEVEVAIIGVTDDPIPEWDDALRRPAGEIGEIAVRGPFVTRSYYGRPAATALAKIAANDGSVWHRMGDVGHFDAAGRLWFCGRKAHRVTTEAGVLFTVPVEGVFNAHPAVFRSALVGIGPPGRQGPAVCVELEPDARGVSTAALTRELSEYAARHEVTAAVRRFLVHPAFPVDVRHNAKIDREALAAWAAARLPEVG